MIDLKIKVYRYNSSDTHTDSVMLIDDKFQCFVLEDRYRTEKVYGETRISDGIYEMELRTIGRLHEKYKNRFPDLHKGMLWLSNVPNFEYILFHIGNDDEDTAGCLLVGYNKTGGQNFLGDSTNAYVDFYEKVIEAMNQGRKVTVQIITLDYPF